MPRHAETSMIEPDITINGELLTFAEAMTLRVAVGSLRISLADPAFRAELGPIGENYDVHLQRIEALMIRGIAQIKAATT